MISPLIMVTNDDGIDSAGLWALVEALIPLGEVLVVAPDRQWSGCGRALPFDVTGKITPASRVVSGQHIEAYAVDASPALAVVHGVVELATRRPALVVSGINSGVNLGTDVTLSGTVGAALEASSFGLPALAVSLEMDPKYHLTGHDGADYGPSMTFAQRLARYILTHGLPYDTDVLNVNIPSDADEATSWRLTRLSRRRSFVPIAPDRSSGQGRPVFRLAGDHKRAELDSDIWALRVDRIVSVTPLSLDLSARADPDLLKESLRSGMATSEIADLSPYFIRYPANILELY